MFDLFGKMGQAVFIYELVIVFSLWGSTFSHKIFGVLELGGPVERG